MTRYLRIAFSINVGIACVLLLALWVRSYWQFYVAYCPSTPPVIANVACGLIQVSLLSNQSVWPHGWGSNWGWKAIRPNRQMAERPSWYWHRDRYFSDGRAFHFPIWSLVLLLSLATFSCAWRLPRFSLRTLLIAITLLGLILGTTAAFSQ